MYRNNAPDFWRPSFRGPSGGILVRGGDGRPYFLFLLSAAHRPPDSRPDRAASASVHVAPRAAQIVFVTLLLPFPPHAAPETRLRAAVEEAALVCGPLFLRDDESPYRSSPPCSGDARTPFRARFSRRAVRTKRALGKGLLFGLAALPPVLPLSQIVAAVLFRMAGYGPNLQDCFHWLSDEHFQSRHRACSDGGRRPHAPRSPKNSCSAAFSSPFCWGTLPRLGGAADGVLLRPRSHVHGPSLLPLLALGSLLHAGYAATGRLLTSIVMHALFQSDLSPPLSRGT
jgi:hypothetical protein